MRQLRTAVASLWRRLKQLAPSLFQRADTGRLRYRNQIYHLLSQHFSIGELEQLAFEAGYDAETLGHEANDKDSLVRALILRSLNDGGLGRLVEAARRDRPFVVWPE